MPDPSTTQRPGADEAVEAATAVLSNESGQRGPGPRQIWAEVAEVVVAEIWPIIEAAVRPDERTRALNLAADAIETQLPGADAVGYYASEVHSGYYQAAMDAEVWLRARALAARPSEGDGQ